MGGAPGLCPSFAVASAGRRSGNSSMISPPPSRRLIVLLRCRLWPCPSLRPPSPTMPYSTSPAFHSRRSRLCLRNLCTTTHRTTPISRPNVFHQAQGPRTPANTTSQPACEYAPPLALSIGRLTAFSFINNEFIKSVDGKTFEVVNPTDESGHMLRAGGLREGCRRRRRCRAQGFRGRVAAGDAQSSEASTCTSSPSCSREP